MKRSQWLTSRDIFSDWPANRESERKSFVSLSNQSSPLACHPLPMSLARFSTGFHRAEVGAQSTFTSADAFTAADPFNTLLAALATESGAPLTTEDTGEPLGVPGTFPYFRPMSWPWLLLGV